MEWSTGLSGYAVVLGLIGLLALLVSLKWRREKRLAADCHAWCERYGYRYLGDDDTVDAISRGDPFAGFGFARHVMRGAHRGRHALVAEWCHKVGRSTRMYELVAVALPRQYSYLEIRWRRHLGQRMMGSAGAAPAGRDFRAAFEVTASDPRLDAWLDSAAITGMLVNSQDTDPYVFRVEGQWVLCVRSGELHVPSVGRRLEMVSALASELP